MSLDFRDQFECLEAIAIALADVMPEPWEELRVDVELEGPKVLIMKTYQPSSGGKRKDVPTVFSLGDWFPQLARLVSTEEKGFYKKCVFTLTKDGEYKAEYEY